MFNAGTVVSYMVLNTDKFKKGLQSAESEVKTFAKTTGGYGNKMKAMGKMLTSFGKQATLGLTVPLAGIATVATKTAADFEASMSKVQAISGASSDEMKLLEDKARQMGATTKFSATEAAEAMQYMGMAGWKTDQMLAGIPGIMDLAAASGEDLASVSDIVTDSLSGFGMTANDTSQFVDLLAKTATSSNTNVSMMGETFKYVAPLFGALGYSAEDAALATGLMANAGVKAGQAGTTLRGAITRLINPTKTSSAWIEKLGINMTDSQGNMIPFRDLLVQLRGKFSTLSKEQKAQAASALFGQEAMSGMLAIMNATDEEFNSLSEATLNYSGAAADMAETMEDNLQGQLTKLKSALQELAISLGSILIPLVRQVIQWIQKWVDKFNALDEGTKKTIVKIGAFVAAVGPLLLVFGRLITVFGNAITIGGKLVNNWSKIMAAAKFLGSGLKAILSVALNPWVLAIGGAITAGVLIVKNWDSIKAMAGKLKNYLGEKFSSIGASISNTWNSACSATSSTWNKMYSYVTNKASEIAQSIPQFFKSLPSQMANIGTYIMQGLLNGITNMGRSIMQTVANIANSITSTFKSILGIHSPSRVFQKYGQYIDEGLTKGMADGEKEVIKQTKSVADNIKKSMEDNVSFLNKIGDGIVNALKEQYKQQEEIQQASLDRQIQKQQDASNKKMKIYDKEYTEKLKLIDKEAYDRMKGIQQQIDSIDNQTKEEEKARKKKQYEDEVAQLKEKMKMAKSAEEKSQIEKRLNDTIAQEKRRILLEQRELEKSALKEQIDNIKNEQSKKQEQLKKEYEYKKKLEEEKVKATVDSLNKEKDKVKEHYSTLSKQEALQAQARKMMINKQQDDIVKLLNKYNPKWQDAGQSFADSLVNGLNSENQTISQAVERSLDLQPTIKNQISALNELEAELKRLQESQDAKSKQSAKSGKGGKGAGAGGAGGGILGDTKQGIDSLGNSVKSAGEQFSNLLSKNAALDESFESSIDTFDIFSDEISKGTQKAVGSFLQMNEKATMSLNQLNWSGQEVTEEMATAITSNFTQMKDKVVKETENKKKLSLHHLNTLFKNSKDITKEEQQNILNMTTKSYDDRIKKTTQSYDRIISIITEAGKQNRKLTKEEMQEINKLQQEQVDNGIDILSKGKEEHELIMTQLKQEGEKISAEQARKIVKYSKEQTDGTIENAEKEYKERLRHAQQLEKEGTKEAKDMAEKVKQEAKRQKDEAVKQAKEMHEGVVQQAKKQAHEHVREIDWETGEVKTRWQKLKSWFSDNPIVRFFKSKDDGGVGKAQNVGRNARGTNNWKGGLTWVGEYGKELMYVPKGAEIYSAHKSKEMMGMGGGDINQEIHIHSPKPLTPRETARQQLHASRQLAMEWRS